MALTISKVPIYSGLGVFFLTLVLLSVTLWQHWQKSIAEILQQNPASYPGSYPVPPNPVSWGTQTVALLADDFYIIANGKRYEAKTTSMSVFSDPGSAFYTTLELMWDENNSPMRLYIYFRSDGNRWWPYEMRTYDGEFPNGNWIIYTNNTANAYDNNQFFNSSLASFYTGDTVEFNSDTNQQFSGKIYFQNLRLLAFKNQPYYGFKLLSPNGGEQWIEGSSREIRWHFEYTNQPNIILPVKTTIMLKNTSGVLVATIADHSVDTHPGDNSYTWIPETWIPVGEYKIDIRMEQPLSSAFGWVYPQDASDQTFTLQKPVLPTPAPPSILPCASPLPGGSPLPCVSPGSVPEDINGDSVVNLADIVMIIGKWRQTCSGCIEDLNGNNVVDLGDLQQIIIAWNRTIPVSSAQ